MNGQAEWKCTITDLVQATSGRVLSQPHSYFSRVGTDSRQSLQNKLFIPLKGENFDGHNFVAKAVAVGAAAVLVSEWREEWEPLKQKASFVQVDDCLQALQSLALFWRRKHRFKVLAITGSNGKTSSKEFTLALLKPHFRVHASRGSFNNHWGVPLSILEADQSHTHLILEMGMNHSKELLRLCQIGEPDVVVCTTVGTAHIGELGSQQAVANAKEEIYQACPDALHIFNMDNEWTMAMQTRSRAKQIRFSSFNPNVDVHMRAQRMTWDGLDITGTIQGQSGQRWVPILGRHNVVNLMVASSLGLAVGLTPDQIWQGLGTIQDSAWGRNQLLTLQNGARVLFDAYNANPDSMQALLKNLFEMDLSGRKFLILGDMRELGAFAEQAHESLGVKAGEMAFAGVWFIGQYSEVFRKGFEKVRKDSPLITSAGIDPAIAQKILEGLRAEDLVAIKGSRGMELEHVLDGWPLSTPLGKKPS